MTEWLTPTCQWFAPEDVAALGMVCAALGALLLAVIALGFGPLRTWIGLPDADDPLLRSSIGDHGGLLTTWRLYRQLGRAHLPSAGFSVSNVPALVVPPGMVERQREGRCMREPASRMV